MQDGSSYHGWTRGSVGARADELVPGWSMFLMEGQRIPKGNSRAVPETRRMSVVVLHIELNPE